MRERRAEVARSFGAALLWLLAVACGARTPLLVCTEPGATRACADVCGAGVETCVGGAWGACAVPDATRACNNVCGAGSQTCTEDAWSDCVVPPAVRVCVGLCGEGRESCVDGGWQPCDAPAPTPPTFSATIRDFDYKTDPDFEPDGGGMRTTVAGMAELGIVMPELDDAGLPIYDGVNSISTHGATLFNAWYRDTPPLNITDPTPYLIPLAPTTANAAIYAFDDESFFPIDGQFFGNEGRIHNYDFTLMLVTYFRYTGGETFRFASDDDSFIFLNRRLAVDLGGLHETLAGSVNLDLQASALGIVKGQVYPMHLFYAERHVVGAALRISVPASDFGVCDGGALAQ